MFNLCPRFLDTNPVNPAILPLRLTMGPVFMAHGAQKLFGWFGGHGLEATAGFFSSQLGLNPGILFASLAGGGEFFGGLLVLLGLFTRLGALSILIVMLVAMFGVHWGSFFLPDGIEYTFILSGVALSLIVSGGGRASVDACLQGRCR